MSQINMQTTLEQRDLSELIFLIAPHVKKLEEQAIDCEWNGQDVTELWSEVRRLKKLLKEGIHYEANF